MTEHKSGDERRKHRRIGVVEGMAEMINLELSDNGHNRSQPAIMTDLSAGGMSLLMFSEPPHAKRFDMTLEIPGLSRVPIAASVVRVHQKGETYSVGLSFIEIAAKTRERIATMADDNSDCDTRLSLHLPEACVPTCHFHLLCTKAAKAPHWKAKK